MGHPQNYRFQLIALLLLVVFAIVSGCSKPQPPALGVTWELAQHRKSILDSIKYNLSLDIPADKSKGINGRIVIDLKMKEAGDLVLDFKEDPQNVLELSANDNLEYKFENGHIVIPVSSLQKGANRIEIDFIAGDLSLNRNDEFLYTLFVPDRASTAFPCFDQPNLKTSYALTLTVPDDWTTLANGTLLSKSDAEGMAVYNYNTTKPISSYLFSFVAGKFETLSRTKGNRTLTMLHRETDSIKVARNVDAIFDLHFSALEWLEAYTGIDYPFQKFAFALVPSFQYGGMEHPGAIQYRAASLFHDENATDNQKLGRARLIAHETAHMWFGNLVTMDWFNDVWLKEVFANFMAAKVVNPNFPEVNHELSFLMAHYPAAYSVDRTQGANPIQQDLDNLINAGSVYGAIIYQKAPIVMRHLERMVGPEVFQSSLQEYLQQHQFGNATWDDLVTIIDNNSPEDIADWSTTWVKSSGMPTITSSLQIGEGNDNGLILRQGNVDNRFWPQDIRLQLVYEDTTSSISLSLKEEEQTKLLDQRVPEYIIPNSDGYTYGLVQYDSTTGPYLLNAAGRFENEVTRGAIWINLYEAMLQGQIAPIDLFNSILNQIPEEENPLITQFLLGRANKIYWQFLSAEERGLNTMRLEELLLKEMNGRDSPSQKAMFYRTFRLVFNSDQAVALVSSWWRKEKEIPGLSFSERDLIVMAYQLAVRAVPDSEEFLAQQIDAIGNADRQARMKFVSKALSGKESDRDAFFESLKDPGNREHEPWVLEALSYLHHPLRKGSSIKYLLPSLELLEEIQLTGDIFFPKRWLDNSLAFYNTTDAAEIVNVFLKSRPQYSPKLREKILQSADNLFRAAELRATQNL